MKFNVELKFYEDDNNINFNDIPTSIQKEFLDLLKTSSKIKNYLEKNISNMGSVCKNNVSHYLKLKIKTIKPIKISSLFGLLGNSLKLDIDANVSQIKKKVVGEMWCGKELNAKEIKDLFTDDNLIDHIDTSIKELRRGNPIKTLTFKNKKYYFYFLSAF